MKKNKILILLLFGLGCQSRGGFEDIALIKQAQRELRVIRNALEEYKIDHKTYPSEGSDLKIALAPYLSKVIYSEGKEISRYTECVLEVQNLLNQINKIISGCKNIKEPQIEETLTRIQESLKSYEIMLSGKEGKIIPLDQEISTLCALIDSLDIMGKKTTLKDSSLYVVERVIETTDSLIKGAQENILTHLTNIKATFQWYKSNILGKKVKAETELFSPESEYDKIKLKLSSPKSEFEKIKDQNVDSTILLLGELISFYFSLESTKDYYDFLLTAQENIKKSFNFISKLNKKTEEAKKAALIVQAQASLHRMADAIRDYRRKKGSFPNPNVNIDSLLHPYFIEVTMSGDSIDRWDEALTWFISTPIYKTEDPKTSFTLEAYVNNEARTHIISRVEVQNKWDEITSAFSTPVIYTTPDSSVTYFLKARANDSGQTWITERPSGRKGV